MLTQRTLWQSTWCTPNIPFDLNPWCKLFPLLSFLRQAASGFSNAAACLATLCSSVVVRIGAESHCRGFCIERFYVLLGWSISDRPSPVVPSYILLLHLLSSWNHHGPLYFSTTRFLPLNFGQNLVSAGVLMIPRDFVVPPLDQHLFRHI
jgi:hypothetical protein